MKVNRMKVFFVVCAFLVLAACSHKVNMVIGLHVNGAQLQNSPMLVTRDSVYNLVLSTENSAEVVLPENFEAGYGVMYLDEEYILLYLEPDKSCDVMVTMVEDGIVALFSGAGAAKNRFVNDKSLISLPDFKLNEEEFIAALEAECQRVEDSLKAQGFDTQFNAIEGQRLRYTVLSALPDYYSGHIYAIGNTDFVPSDYYYQKLQSLFVEDETLLHLGVYTEYMKDMVSYVAIHNLVEFEDYQYILEELEFVEQHFKNPALKEYMVDCIIYNEVEMNGVNHLGELQPIYYAHVKDSAKKARFDALCNNYLKTAKGQPSPEFALSDVNGEIVRLSDLAGKYVYIDCWATWCGPCMREQPYLSELEKEYAGRNICFVSISCDQDKTAWEQMVKEKKLGGIQLIEDGNQAFTNAYTVTTIPRFILLDKEGKIIDADAPRPSESSLVELFDSLEGL